MEKKTAQKVAQKTKKRASATKKTKKKKSFEIDSSGESDVNDSFTGKIGKVT